MLLPPFDRHVPVCVASPVCTAAPTKRRMLQALCFAILLFCRCDEQSTTQLIAQLIADAGARLHFMHLSAHQAGLSCSLVRVGPRLIGDWRADEECSQEGASIRMASHCKCTNSTIGGVFFASPDSPRFQSGFSEGTKCRLACSDTGICCSRHDTHWRLDRQFNRRPLAQDCFGRGASHGKSSIARLERFCLGFLKVVGIPAKLRVHVTSDLELLWASLADGQIQIYAESWLEEEGVQLAS